MMAPPTNQRRGEPITASFLNRIKAMLLRSIVGGPGILVQFHGDQIVIRLSSQTATGGGLFNIRKVTDVFPAIPGRPTLIATPAQLWYSDEGLTKWYPLARYTDATGAPASAVDGIVEE